MKFTICLIALLLSTGCTPTLQQTDFYREMVVADKLCQQQGQRAAFLVDGRYGCMPVVQKPDTDQPATSPAPSAD